MLTFILYIAVLIIGILSFHAADNVENDGIQALLMILGLFSLLAVLGFTAVGMFTFCSTNPLNIAP